MLQGEDKALAVTISVGGALQSIDDMLNLILYIYYKKSEVAIIKYAKTAAAGFTTLLRVSATEYTAIIPYTLTLNQPTIDLLVECEIQETDVRFAGSIRRTKGKGTITDVGKSIITE